MIKKALLSIFIIGSILTIYSIDLNATSNISVEQKIPSVYEDYIVLKNDIEYFKNRRIVVNNEYEGVKWKTGYTTTEVNVREKPSTESEILDVYKFNHKVEYSEGDDKWYIIRRGDDGIAFISKKYISDDKIEFKVRDDVPDNRIKSYMGYHMITSTSSPQYRLQHTIAYTGKYGIRQVNGRFCVAVGSAYLTKIGTYFDLILKNGTVIPCILADQKANKDTNASNKITLHDMSLTEFVVEQWSLPYTVTKMGDISYTCKEWNSPVEKIKIYDKVEKF